MDEPVSQFPPELAPSPSPVAEVPAAEGEATALVDQLRRTSDLIAAERLPEAEALLVSLRSRSVRDLRILKLLAVVRFKLGRLQEARDVYRQAAEVAPDDGAVRLNLGLIALKMEAFAEAAQELEAAVRLHPDDRRAWSYLGYAYAREGASLQAATAFRRAGQHELAAEMERASAPLVRPADEAGLVEGFLPERVAANAASGVATPRPIVQAQDGCVDTPVPLAGGRAGSMVATLAGFISARLLPPGTSQAGSGALGHGVLSFKAGTDSHVRASTLLAAVGDGGLTLARRRARGHLSDQALADGDDRFLRVEGNVDLLLASPDQRRPLIALALDRDILYLQASRVAAWDAEVVWESGSLPGNGSPLLQFRGNGRVVILAGEDELVAIRIKEGDRMTVQSARLAGWLGRVVVQSRSVDGGRTENDHVSCEGEGVLLISKHGQYR